MLAQLKTVVLIREAIKLAFLWASWVYGASAFVGSIILSKWPEKENFLLKLDSLFLLFHVRNCQETEDFSVYYSLQRTAQPGSNQNRKRSGRPRCTTKQEDKYIRVSSLRNRCHTGPQLAASLNGTRKTPVSTSTVKRRLRDDGLLGRVAKKKPYLRLANKRKRLRWGKEHRHWTEEDWKKVSWTVWGVWITQITQVKRCWRSAWRHLSSMVEVMWWSGAALVLVKWEMCTR